MIKMNIFAVLIGLLFGVGIIISGMVNPAKVLNFFDLFGLFDPSLAFVMGGGLIVTLAGYYVIFKYVKAPLIKDKAAGSQFILPKDQAITKRLILGSLIFGAGWGIAGFCPGASIPAIGTMLPQVLMFVLPMLAGILITRRIIK